MELCFPWNGETVFRNRISAILSMHCPSGLKAASCIALLMDTAIWFLHPIRRAATYDIDGILHVSVKSSGGDYRDRLILNPRLHLTEEGKARAMERIQEIQLAAQGSQKNRFLLERGLRLYEQTSGRLRDMAGQLVGYWKWLMNQGSLIEQQRNYEKVKEQMDYLETVAEADPLAENFWFDEPEESFEDLGDEGEK